MQIGILGLNTLVFIMYDIGIDFNVEPYDKH